MPSGQGRKGGSNQGWEIQHNQTRKGGKYPGIRKLTASWKDLQSWFTSQAAAKPRIDSCGKRLGNPSRPLGGTPAASDYTLVGRVHGRTCLGPTVEACQRIDPSRASCACGLGYREACPAATGAVSVGARRDKGYIHAKHAYGN